MFYIEEKIVKDFLILAVCAFLLILGVTICTDAAQAASHAENLKLRMSFEGGEVLVNLYDSQATREFVAMLPLTLAFEDYARAEKIAYLPKKLSSEAPLSSSNQGDFTYYAPWGNLAVFYNGYGSDSRLYILGKIESGKGELANMNRNFTATLEVLKQ
ncbi:hypothetical protein LJC31_05970 [Synergistaceae bacterium OttesenSCG-928-I11]|nr:hypothetical protein [Synergistaceae bacterium OttesenSCG-928-I11]